MSVETVDFEEQFRLQSLLKLTQPPAQVCGWQGGLCSVDEDTKAA